MKKLTLNFVCQTLNLPMPSADGAIGQVLTDSRAVQEHDLFIALKGERFDAHDFVADVVSKGAFALVSRADCAKLPNTFLVADTLTALQTLSAAWRKEINPYVFGITGSSGKTTVKEMLASILRHTFGEQSVLATAGNFNNHIGLPLTLLQLQEQHRYAVIEMGMNHFGELALLTQLAKPDCALVNNALRAHIGCGFSGVSDIAQAKSEIYQGLNEQGVACLPLEDDHFTLLQTATTDKVSCTFGVQQGDVHAEHIVLNAYSSHFDLCHQHQSVAVHLPVAGKHNIANACAAAAMAISAGVCLNDIAQGLQKFSNIQGRLQKKQGIKNSTIIDDTYNANPDSMKAALDVLAALPQPRIFVMGDMGELGEQESANMHKEVGEYARGLGIEYAYFVGDDSVEAAEHFGEQGLWFADKDPLIQVLLHQLPEHASVLVKGSRFMKMETVVSALQLSAETE